VAALPDPFLLHFLSLVGPVTGLRVLDVGCGRGRNAVYLAAAGARVTALDHAVRMVKACAAAAGAVGATLDIAAANAAALPFTPAAFDVAVCTSVLELVEDAEAGRVTGEVRRVVAPGGRVLVVVAAAEGSDADPAGRPPLRARLTTRAQLEGWFAGWRTEALLHLRLVEPASAPVRAQWAYIGRAPG
jgi:ubiquinone/menaquinone biosynthesis C-methylase UbiE